MKLSVCIPMYNEIQIPADTARALSAALDSLAVSGALSSYEIIFCSDGSTDSCDAAVEKAALDEGLHSVRVIGYSENRGKGAAVRTAVLESCGDAVIYTDCDLAYGTEIIGRSLEYVKRFDVVFGSRNIDRDGYEGYTAVRKLASKAYIKVLAMTAGLKLSDSQCGFKILRGEAARKIFSMCRTDGFAFDFEVLMLAQKLGYTVGEMPAKVINHRESTVRMLRDSVNMLRDIRRIRKRVRKSGEQHL